MVLARRCDQPARLESFTAFRDFSPTQKIPRNAIARSAGLVVAESVFGGISEPALRIVKAFAAALHAHDPETWRHTRRVTRLSLRLGRALGMCPAELLQLRLGALLHDIGKLSVCRAILQKPAALSGEEMAQIRRHPAQGAEMLAAAGLSRRALPVVRSHHERWDGLGYPDGLRGDNIPLLARLVAITDAFDAITCDRPYRRGATVRVAVEILTQGSGSHFDPALVETFRQLIG